ncbi:MAG: glucose-6-phosphate isomerase [halophilic archaeon J07HX5]|nr:MAG: glucose-6-phosphate isomerase [halophilic archaeon J07HX5]
MRVDIGNALATVATPGVATVALEDLDDRVTAAHKQISTQRSTDTFGYAALNLPEQADADAIGDAIAGVADAAAVLTVGIGGSALGATTVSAATGPHETTHTALDNVDPASVTATLDRLPLTKTAVHVVSRSGTTTETLANFRVVRAAMEQAGVDWTERTVVTTGPDGPLRTLAREHGLPTLPVPEGVPGRFAALSPVGLVPAAIQGVDISAVLTGGRAGAASLAPSLFDCPAYAYGAVAYALGQRGARSNVVMPYAERLEPFAEWFAQLWAESLGKDGRGQTPVRALGATDQHSQLQLYRAGPRDKLVTLVQPRDREDRAIPATGADELAYLDGASLGAVLDAEFEATEASLAAAGRPTVRVEIDRLGPESVGRLLYMMEAACVLVGELADVETFTQPAVEWGKRATQGLLAESPMTSETAAVSDKTQYYID